MDEEKISLKRILPLLAVIVLGGLVFLSVQKGELAGTIIHHTVFYNEPTLTAHAYLVKFIGDKDYLLKKREWKALPQASITKLLTAVLAREELTSSEWINFSKEAKDVEPKISTVKEGGSLLLDDALRLALMESDNDAALALAQKVGEKLHALSPPEAITNFVELLNQKKKDLGLKNSNFENPIGLDNKNHYASAEDLAKIAEYIWYNHADLWEISREIETVVYSDTGKEYRVSNTNELLKEFPTILGSKTGFTDKAKGALLLIYSVGPNKTAVIIILGSEDRFGDGKKIIKWLETINE